MHTQTWWSLGDLHQGSCGPLILSLPPREPKPNLRSQAQSMVRNPFILAFEGHRTKCQVHSNERDTWNIYCGVYCLPSVLSSIPLSKQA